MSTSYTTLLGLALPVTGELQDTWGDVVNASITELLDTAIAGTTTLSTDADVTLTTTTGAANQARQLIINCTGARTTAKTITAPAASKAYIVINATTGGYAVNIVGVGPTAGVSIANGEKALVVWNGSDFVKASSSVSVTSVAMSVPSFLSVAGSPITSSGTLAVTLSGTALPVANGGTGITSFGTGVATWLGTPSSANLAAAVTDETGTGALVFANTPTLVSPILGTPTSGTLTNCTLPVGGISGLGSGVATWLATPSSANLASAVTGETGTGALVFGTSPTLTTPTITGYTETVVSATGSSFTPDISTGTVFVYTTNANTTITLPTAAAGKSYTISIIYGGAHTVTWAGGTSLIWPDNTAPTATSATGKRDSFGFRCEDTSYTLGSIIGQNYPA